MNRPPAGYVMAHFTTSSEAVHFSLSDGSNARRWRLAHEMPVLHSSVGTGGARDPFLCSMGGSYFVVATDLRTLDEGDTAWDDAIVSGSRSVVVWQSSDLLHWSAPWLLEVAPVDTGMAWAPKVLTDDTTGLASIIWASKIREDGRWTPSRILGATTRDFRQVSEPEAVQVDDADVIDTTFVRDGSRWYRFSKIGPADGSGPGIVQDLLPRDSIRGSGERVAARIGYEVSPQVEGPLVFQDHENDAWLLLLDRFDDDQGYFAMETPDIARPDWKPANTFSLPSGVKHGSVLALDETEWTVLTAHLSRTTNLPNDTTKELP